MSIEERFTVGEFIFTNRAYKTVGHKLTGWRPLGPLAVPSGWQTGVDEWTYSPGESFLLSRAAALREVFRLNAERLRERLHASNFFHWAVCLSVVERVEMFASVEFDGTAVAISLKAEYQCQLIVPTGTEALSVLGEPRDVYPIEEVAAAMGRSVKRGGIRWPRHGVQVVDGYLPRSEVERLLVSLPGWLKPMPSAERPAA